MVFGWCIEIYKNKNPSGNPWSEAQIIRAKAVIFRSFNSIAIY
jgi:hypothetical protein